MISTTASKTQIIVYKFSASSDTSSSKTTELAQRIAIDEINADPYILSDYKLTLNVSDAEEDEETALINAINTAQSYSQCSLQQNSLISPIVLGPPWSSHSVLTSRVFGIYHLLQISASATSPALSDKTKYLPFFRTIGNDNSQGNAIIEFCKKFEWKRIGVVYQNDNYGQDFNKVIQEQAEKYNLEIEEQNKECTKCIEVHSKPFLSDDIDSIKMAAEYIKQQQLYVTILISQGKQVYKLLNEGNFSYPYFFIGTDAWFSSGEIKEDNLTDFVYGINGSVGVMPGSPSMFNETEYQDNNIYDGNMTIYNISKIKFENVTRKIKEEMQDNEINLAFMGYAYDAMYALAHSLDIYDKRTNSLKQQLMDCNFKNISNDLRDILNNDVSFIGITGPVNFKNGDRVNDMFVYGMVNINNEGNVSITKLGYFANESAVITAEEITYPGTTRNVTSTPIVSDKRIGIRSGTLLTVGGTYLVIFLMAFILRFLKRNDKGKVEYLSMIIGFILSWILMISYGLQKNELYFIGDKYQIWYDIWCLSFPIVVCIAFTFTFLAFITSKSELMRIIIKFMKKEDFGGYKGDKMVSNKLWNCLIADFIIISIWIIVYFSLYLTASNVKLLQYEFIKIGNINDSKYDKMEKIQNFYPICSAHWSTNIFYCTLLIYKIGQMHYAIDNNVGGMISYIILVVCMFCVALIAGAWYTLDQFLMNEKINQVIHYSILAFVVIFIYLLWIIPEYYYLSKKRVCHYLCNKDDCNESTQKETTTTTRNETTSPDTSTITPGTSTDSGNSGHPHLTAEEQAEQMMVIQINHDGNNNDDIIIEEENDDNVEIQISKLGHTAILSVPSDSEIQPPKKVKPVMYDEYNEEALELRPINEQKTLSVDINDTELHDDDK